MVELEQQTAEASMEAYEARVTRLTSDMSLGIPIEEIGRNMEPVHALEAGFCPYANACEDAKNGEIFKTYCDKDRGKDCIEKARRDNYRLNGGLH